MRRPTSLPRLIMVMLAGGALSASALAQDSADLSFAPEEGAEYWLQKVVSTSLSTFDRPGAAGVVTNADTRYMSYRCEVVDVDDQSGEVNRMEEIRHLRIEIDRSGWDYPHYDSNLPKRAAPNPLRRLDLAVNRQTQLTVISTAAGDTIERVHITPVQQSIDRYFELFDSAVGPLETLRASVLSQQFNQSFGVGLPLLSGAEQTPGDTWTSSQRLIVPYIGETSITWSCTLKSMDGAIAIIEATPSIEVLREYEAVESARFTLRDISGSALLNYDTTNDRVVYFESTLDLPMGVKLANPLGAFDEFEAAVKLQNEVVEIGETDVPPRGKAGGREWMEGER